MTLTFGQRMLRVEDGMRGVVGYNGPELRILYQDRGEERIALKKEIWVVDDLKPGPLVPSERLIIAAWADRALECIERNKPHPTWIAPTEVRVPYDPELVRVITEYLAERETRPAQS